MIDKIQKGDPETQSEDLVSSNISKLKELFPEIVTEGKIDFTALQEILGEEVESGDEYYRFTWAGKAQARREAHKPSTGTLRPCIDESVDWDSTENLYIEGDNLEVLKLLQKSYAGKIKVVYVDPPYNTGKDILYKNDYHDNLNAYLRFTNQIDDYGKSVINNTDSQGRFHSNWLNMMYPLIRLSKNILTDDGFLICSIDHYEVHNLIKVCDDNFGEENRIGILAIVHKPEGRNQSKFFGESHEYMLFYAKKKKEANLKNVIIDDSRKGEYNLIDDSGNYKLKNFIRLSDGKYSLRENKPNFYYPIYVSDGLDKLSCEALNDNYIAVYPITISGQERTWKTTMETCKERINSGDVIAKRENGNIVIYEKLRESQVIKTHWIDKKYHAYHFGTKVVDALLKAKTFDFPKSVDLIKDVIKLTTDKDDIIADIFSGSGTTAHSIYLQNLEDNQQRKHIQVQLPFPTDINSDASKAGYKTISEIGKERIRRAAKKIAEEHPEKAKDLDLGFKVFKLDTSNVNAWDGTPDNLEKELFDSVSNIKADRSEEDVLYEILLKYGLDLTLPIEQKEIAGSQVYNVGYGALFICLAENITKDISEGIGAWKEELEPEICRVVFKDSGFKSDSDKSNAVQTLKRFGITEIKSI